ncbi:hypothetical protein SAMN05444166_2983 [Singulisphaera sp. GP187]|nr:hypothetical protein SAMN05444166_2983 [Singulisphaera sp. GP187]
MAGNPKHVDLVLLCIESCTSPGCHGLYPTREPKAQAIVHGLSTTRGTQRQ